MAYWKEILLCVLIALLIIFSRLYNNEVSKRKSLESSLEVQKKISEIERNHKEFLEREKRTEELDNQLDALKIKKTTVRTEVKDEVKDIDITDLCSKFIESGYPCVVR